MNSFRLPTSIFIIDRGVDHLYFARLPAETLPDAMSAKEAGGIRRIVKARDGVPANVLLSCTKVDK